MQKQEVRTLRNFNDTASVRDSCLTTAAVTASPYLPDGGVNTLRQGKAWHASLQCVNKPSTVQYRQTLYKPLTV